MADLKKWFPFMFKRTEDKADRPQVLAKTSAAPTAQSLMPGFPADVGRLMERMFSEPFFSRPLSLFNEMDRFFGDFSPTSFSPTVDLIDEGTHVKLTVELPGLDKDDLELSVHEGALTLRGEKKYEGKKEEKGCYRTERYFGMFQRSIPLPVDVDLGKAEAKFEKGVLTVRFPKSERGEPQRKIPVA
jgi:HSP20 family protein